MGPSDRGFDDGLDDYLTETCRQCGEIVAVRPEDERPDFQPFTCDDCVRATVNRAARAERLSHYLFDILAETARRRA